jgi:chromosome segregation ATPase
MPDLLDKIDGIEATEKVTSELQQKVDRLTELVGKQKKIIADQSGIIDQQKGKLDGQLEIPDDVYELREIIGSQRAQLNEKDREIELAKGQYVEIQTELEHFKTRLDPTQSKLDGALGTIGQIKAEIAEKNSQILVKDETIKTLSNKIGEGAAYSNRLKLELEELQKDQALDVAMIKDEHLRETQKLREEMGKLDSILMDSKLESSEAGSTAQSMAARFEEVRNKYDELVNKIEEKDNEKRLLDKDINRLNEIVDKLSTWKADNKPTIEYFNKLSILMEQEALFKAFLIIMQVKSMAIEDLQKAIGLPIVSLKKNVQKLEQVDLVEMDDEGKITLTKSE